MAMRFLPQSLPLRHVTKGLALALAAPVVLSAPYLYADDNWAFLPAIKQEGSWASNPLLLHNGYESVYGSITTPSLEITSKTPSTTLDGKISVSEGIFNLSGYNSTDAHSSASLKQQLENWSVGLAGHADYDTTRTSELTTFNTHTLGSVRHFGGALTPEISYAISPVEKLFLSGNYLKSRYESGIFTDYHIMGVSPSYQYNYDPLNTLVVAMQFQRYQTDGAVDANVDSVAPTLGWLSHLTPQVTLQATVGGQEYRQQGVPSTPEQWKWEGIYTLSADYAGESDTLGLKLNRSLHPYANGTEAFLNTVTLTEKHEISPLFTANAALSYQFTNKKAAGTNLKSLVDANAALSFHATETIDIDASYRYREQSLTGVSSNQTDNAALISLVYRPVLSPINGNK